MLRFALIGIGRFGKHYLRILQSMPNVDLVAIASASERTLAEVSVPHSVKRTTSAEEIFDDASVDAVVIATPTETHFSLASSALKKGKHVLLEKPMAATLEEAKALAAIAASSSAILMIGHQYCYNDHILLLKQKIDEGFFGNLRYIYAEHFYTRPQEGKIGCFWETATHELAILDYLFGAFSIEEKTTRFEDFFSRGRDDFANVHFTLHSKAYSQILENIGIRNTGGQSEIPKSGIPVTIVTSWCAPEKVRRFTLVGERGAAVFDEVKDKENPMRLYGAIKETYQEFPISIMAKEPLQNEVMHFAERIQERHLPLTDHHHGLRVTRYLNQLSSIS